ncbi:vitamin B6 photo-protection and homoeostasis-domain-containing protein [Hypoxylon crocopeplum]|nr:vitamin B6 photo-protection and homoeostasis-domain-containing protein [Hypoxylon crocopeplum]
MLVDQSKMSPLTAVIVYDGCGQSRVYDQDGTQVVNEKPGRSNVKDLMGVFLPAGYPHTVTPDYTPYQIYDSFQAFFSTIAGLLSSRAVLQGFGVGDSGSSATAALLLTILQESTGRLATILFAHRYGLAIEPECKYYRFIADIVNDVALFLDIMSPALSTYPKIMALCGAGVLRALCGVSGGSAKASLSAHFAKNGNLAELNAKDNSQETVISLLGLLAGSILVQFVHSKEAVMAWMIVLVGLHLWTNYKAVRSVQLRSLNKQRTCIVLDELIRSGRVLSPEQVAARESILSWVGPRISFANTFPKGPELKGIDFYSIRHKPYVIVNNGGAKKIYMKDRQEVDDIHDPSDARAIHRALRAWVEAYCGTADVDWPEFRRVGWKVRVDALETYPSVLLNVKFAA